MSRSRSLGGSLIAFLAFSKLTNAQTQESSTGVGDYVAAGLGASSASSSVAPTQPVAEGLVTVNGTVFTATKLADGDILVANTTVHPSAPSSSRISASASLITPVSNTSVDDCFSSWDSWWSASWLESYGTYKPERTYTTSWTVTISAYNGTTETFTSTVDTTQTIFNGLFPIETDTVHTTSKTTLTGLSEPATTSSSVATVTSSSLIRKNNTLHEPTCTLPKIVPACQSQWERWITTQLAPAPTPPPHCDINAGFLNNRNTVPPCAKSYSSAVESYSSFASAYASPFCTQAAVTGSLCESIRENYVHQGNYNFDAEVATTQYLPFFSAGYMGGFSNISAGNFNTTWFWPTSSTLGAPSCTLGCGRCAVTGGTVQLIYWPQTPTATGANNTAPRTSPAGPVTVETLGTTFTSPTLYISYASVYAANGCSVIGTNISSTIVAIPTNSPLSSVYGGTIPCDAHMRYTQEWTATAPFTVEDMNEPVPYSIYSSQPWCATYLRNNGCQGSCPTSQAYKPILVVPEEVLQDMEPAWSTCYGDVRGVYDPPVALQARSSEAGVSMPGATTTEGSQTQTATPASGPGPTTPSQTSTPTPAVPVALSDVASDSVPGPSGYDPTSAHGADPTASGVSDQTSANDPVSTAGSDSDPGSAGEPSGQDIAATTTQNAGGILASLLGGGAGTTGDTAQDPSAEHQTSADDPVGTAVSDNDPGSAGQPSGQNVAATTTQNAGGILASLLGAGSSTTAGAAQDSSADASPLAASVLASAGGAEDSSSADSQGSADPTAGAVGLSAGSTAQPSIATIESQAYTVIPAASNSAVVVAQGGSSLSLTPGATVATLGGQQISVASDGVVIGGGSGVTTIAAIGNQAGSAIPSGTAVVNAQAYSIVSQASGSSSGIVVANGDASATLSAGGAAVTLGGQLISAGSAGQIMAGSSTIGQTSDLSSTVAGEETGVVAASASSSASGQVSDPTSARSTSVATGVTAQSSSTPTASSSAAEGTTASLGFALVALLLGVLLL